MEKKAKKARIIEATPLLRAQETTKLEREAAKGKVLKKKQTAQAIAINEPTSWPKPADKPVATSSSKSKQKSVAEPSIISGVAPFQSQVAKQKAPVPTFGCWRCCHVSLEGLRIYRSYRGLVGAC